MQNDVSWTYLDAHQGLLGNKLRSSFKSCFVSDRVVPRVRFTTACEPEGMIQEEASAGAAGGWSTVVALGVSSFF